MDDVLETDQLMITGEQKRKRPSFIMLFLLAIGSFFFFLYLTFPYNVVKEFVASQVSRQGGISLFIGQLEPNLPIGLSVSDVQLSTSTGGGKVELQSIDVSLSLLSLLTGKAGAAVSLGSKGGGELDIFANLGLGGLFSGNVVPSNVEVQAADFPIVGLANFGIAMAAKNSSSNALVADFLKKFRIGGNLSGSIDMDIDPDDLAQSLGSLNIGLKRGYFWLDDPSLNIAKQDFKKAQVVANLDNSKLKIDKKSGFISQELEFLFFGNITFKQSLAKSLINMEVDLTLKESLKNNIGFLIDSMTGGVDGKSRFRLKGALLSPERVNIQG